MLPDDEMILRKKQIIYSVELERKDILKFIIDLRNYTVMIEKWYCLPHKLSKDLNKYHDAFATCCLLY